MNQQIVPIQQEDLRRTIARCEIRTDNDIVTLRYQWRAHESAVYVIVHHCLRDSPGEPYEKVAYDCLNPHLVTEDEDHPLSILYEEQWKTINECKQAVMSITSERAVTRSTRIAYVTNPPTKVGVYRDMHDKIKNRPWVFTAHVKGMHEQKGFGTRAAALQALNDYLMKDTPQAAISSPSRWKKALMGIMQHVKNCSQ